MAGRYGKYLRPRTDREKSLVVLLDDIDRDIAALQLKRAVLVQDIMTERAEQLTGKVRTMSKRLLKHSMKVAVVAVALVLGAAAWVEAQQLPLPSGPVTFCGQQAAPGADSYTVSVDGAAATPLTMDATIDSRCPAGTTHSFQLPANQFPIGNHTVQVTGINPFGSTPGPSYAVTVGIAPGQFSITAVLPPAGE